MTSGSPDWAAAAAALPTAARAERERPFWQAVVAAWRWRRVVDAGCGSGFHVRLLRDLGAEAVGFDAALAALSRERLPRVLAGDLAHPPFREGAFDAALCLGNTLSLLASRTAQSAALAALARLVGPGGVVVLQGEDAGALVDGGPLVRTRRAGEGTVHVRVFERVGRRVRMLAAVVGDGAEARLSPALLLPTSPASVERLAAVQGLVPVSFPAAPPGGGAGWWVALSVPCS
jgi:SAM-dependent methyltransferase